MLQTEFEFTLPMGLIDADGALHRDGVMRLATAADEILPQRDERVRANPAYLNVIILSRVVTRLGDLRHISTATIERLFTVVWDRWHPENPETAGGAPELVYAALDDLRPLVEEIDALWDRLGCSLQEQEVR